MAAENKKSKGFSLPILQGVLRIKGSQVSADIVAGITLAALNIPQALGYTKIAGTPVISGLYAILLPMFIFAVFGSSRYLVVGADSATAAILAASGSPEYMALCGLLALMAAGFLILARMIGLSFLADFLSRTVLVGFLTGVGIQVALMEIGGMLGLPRGGHSPVSRFFQDLQHLSQTNFYALAVSVAVLVIILGFQKISKKIPGALIAVIGAIVASWTLDLPSYGVATLGTVPEGLPRFGWPQADLNPSLLKNLLSTAFSLFVVILAQSAATSRAFAVRYNESFDEKAARLSKRQWTDRQTYLIYSLVTGAIMEKIKARLYLFVWELNDHLRVGFCLPLGVAMYGFGWWRGWGWELSFLSGWILALGAYLVLLGIVIVSADAAETRERISKVDPTRWFLLIVLSLVALLGNMSVAIILTAVGQRPVIHAQLFLALSVIAVILSWLLLHTAFGQHYARRYYEETDRHGIPFPGGLHRGFVFPGTPDPTYLDFLYVSFTIGLTYAMSDVNVTNEVQRRTVLLHSVISFFFYSTVLGVVLNAIVTS